MQRAPYQEQLLFCAPLGNLSRIRVTGGDWGHCGLQKTNLHYISTLCELLTCRGLEKALHQYAQPGCILRPPWDALERGWGDWWW